VAVRRLPSTVLTTAVVLAACAGGGAGTTDAETVERGRQLYDASCASCHGGATGGEISDIPPPHNAEGHTWHHSDCLLADIVRDGPAPRPGTGEDFPAMPAFGDELGDDDIAAILAYLKTWWTEEQREFQAEVTALECADG
jgi:mono/diheme cytochrome c family protein